MTLQETLILIEKRQYHCPYCKKTLTPTSKHITTQVQNNISPILCSTCFQKHHGTLFNDMYRDSLRKSSKKYYNTQKTKFNRWIYNKYKKKGEPISPYNEFKDWFNDQSKTCHYCDTKLNNDEKLELQIDKKNPEKGYVVHNMILCCTHCYKVKNNLFTYIQMRILGGVMDKIKKGVPIKKIIFET